MNTIYRARKSTAICPYLILGLAKGCGRLALEDTYWRLVDALDESRFLHSPQSWVQAGQAMLEVENAYQRILASDFEEDEEADQFEPFWPKLGQILIKSGKINLRQLHDAILVQQTQHSPLGEILMDRGLINQEELAAFLSSQNLIELPDDSSYSLGLRLIGLRVVPEDMVCIALLEYCDFQKPPEETLIEKGWLSREVFEAILRAS